MNKELLSEITHKEEVNSGSKDELPAGIQKHCQSTWQRS